MSDANPELSRLAELVGGIRLHEHLCLIYETPEEQFAAAVPFLRSGLDRGEKCLYVADEDSGTAVLNALRKAGTDVDRHLRSGTLIRTNKPESDVQPGRLDLDWWIDYLSQSLQGAGDSRFSGLKTWLGEMTWTLEEKLLPEKLIEFEAKISRFVRQHEVRALCQYYRNRFSPDLILDVIRTHPVVVYGGIICKNPYYVPPEEFLKPDQPSLEVERLLNNMLAAEQSLGQLRALAGRLQTVREEERTRAAREIHDELGQALTAIKLEFTALLRELPANQEPVRQRSQSILNLLDEGIQSIRRIATELRPGILDDLGLAAAVEWVAKEFQTRTGTKVHVSLPNVEIAMDPERDTALFRILQETLTNVARHASATQVDVRLAKEDGTLILEVRDNGKGIRQDQLSGGKSFGVLGMQERAVMLGGEINITGIPGKGTTVSVRIPETRRTAPE